MLAAAAGDYGKPRPWLVVQANKHNDTGRPGSILVCPFTTHDEALSYRIPVDLPLGDTLRRSWVMVDKLMAVKRERIVATIATVSTDRLKAVELAIVDLLDLPKAP